MNIDYIINKNDDKFVFIYDVEYQLYQNIPEHSSRQIIKTAEIEGMKN